MKKFKRWHKTGSNDLLLPAGLFTGMGIGFITDQLVGGIFLGLGLGFFAIVLTRNKKRK